MQETKNVI